MTNSIITRVVRCDDISQLLLRDRLRFAVVLLPQLVHHGNYAVEPFGHAGPHPVLKGRNAPLVVSFLVIMCFPGCNCNKQKKLCKQLREHFHTTLEHKITWKGFFFFSALCSKGRQEIAVRMARYYSQNIWMVSSFPFLFLSSIC